jgi:hypothetical protein
MSTCRREADNSRTRLKNLRQIEEIDSRAGLIVQRVFV